LLGFAALTTSLRTALTGQPACDPKPFRNEQRHRYDFAFAGGMA